MSRKSKKELAKAQALLAKAEKMQRKTQKMKNELLRMQLTMMQAQAGAAQPDYGAADTGYGSQLHADEVSDVPASAAGSGSRIVRHFRSNRMLYAGIGAVILVACVFLVYTATTRGHEASAAAAGNSGEPLNETPAPATPEESAQPPGNVVVLDTWEMPEELVEISSNAFIDADRIACIQDADAIIYTYNLKTRKVENRLKFGKPGDFEALSVVGDTYYALRSDGHLFEVQPAGSGKPAVKEYKLPLKAENETEPMFYDEANNRLLVGVKEKDPVSNEYKGVYSFDLATKSMSLKPVMTIPAVHGGEAGSSSKQKNNKQRPIKPSEIALDPKSGDLFVLNGPQAEFLIVGKDGSLKQRIQLDKSIFPQPEGMCFSPSGELYISSEGGKKRPGVIAKVELQ